MLLLTSYCRSPSGVVELGQARRGAPCAAGEVGHVYRLRARHDGALRQFADAAPGGEVVDVLRQWQAVAQAVDDAHLEHGVDVVVRVGVGVSRGDWKGVL